MYEELPKFELSEESSQFELSEELPKFELSEELPKFELSKTIYNIILHWRMFQSLDYDRCPNLPYMKFIDTRSKKVY